MLLEFPNDPATYTLDLQYMFGAEMLVAPIYNERGERTVYLPEGQWIDYWTHEVFSGPRTLTLQVPLETLPLYVRANALIPTTKPASFTPDEPCEEITIDAYLLDKGEFELHDTDGLTRVTAHFGGEQLLVTIDGAKERLALRLLPLTGTPHVTQVMVNAHTALEIAPGESLANYANAWTRLPDGAILLQCQQ